MDSVLKHSLMDEYMFQEGEKVINVALNNELKLNK